MHTENNPIITPAEREVLGGNRCGAFGPDARPTIGDLIETMFETPDLPDDAPLPVKALRCIIDELDLLQDAVIGSSDCLDPELLRCILVRAEHRARVALILWERLEAATRPEPEGQAS